VRFVIGPYVDRLGFFLESYGQINDFRIVGCPSFRLLILIIVVVTCEGIPAVCPVVFPIVPGEHNANDGGNDCQDGGNQPGADWKCLLQRLIDDAGMCDSERRHEGGCSSESRFDPAGHIVARRPNGAQNANGCEDAEDPVPAEAEDNQRRDGADRSHDGTYCQKLFHNAFLLFGVLFLVGGCYLWGVVKQGSFLVSIISHFLFFVNFLQLSMFQSIKLVGFPLLIK